MNFKWISRLLLYLTILLIPFYFFRFSFLGIKTNIFEIAVFASTLFFLCSLAQNRDKKISFKKEFQTWLLPIIFLLLALASIFIADDKTKALGIFKGWFLVPIMFGWLINKNFNKRSVFKISIPIFISVLIVSVWALLQKTGIIGTLFYQVGDGSFNEYIREGRAFGPFESPNFLAMFLVPAVFLALPIIEFLKNKVAKTAALALFLLPLLTLYASGSRAGIIALAVCFFVFVNYRFVNLQKSKERRPFYVALFVSLFVLVNVGYLFFATHNFNPMSGGDKIRVEIYKYSDILLRNNPVSGVGLGGFEDRISKISENNASFQLYAMSYALHPHNLFLAIWLSTGIAGLVIFIFILASIFKRLFTSDSRLRSYFVAAIVAILIHGVFDTTYFKNDLAALFWLIYSGAVILGNLNEEQISEN